MGSETQLHTANMYCNVSLYGHAAFRPGSRSSYAIMTNRSFIVRHVRAVKSRRARKRELRSWFPTAGKKEITVTVSGPTGSGTRGE